MKDTIQELFYIIRNNPKQARIAIILDSIIGSVAALVVYVLLTTTGLSFVGGTLFALSAAFFLVSVGIMGFILMRNGGMVYGASAMGTSMVDDDNATEYDVDMDQEREQQ
jgi:hypothetical protein